uniref:Uncharacterized protein n=1 Tax=Geospiza parvula TaxID=87175 RepID=A0A8U8AV76_GEOPR
ISGSKSSRGAALFNKPTSSSNSVAKTEEGNLIDGALEKETEKQDHNVFVLSFLFELTLTKNHLCKGLAASILILSIFSRYRNSIFYISKAF